MQIHHHATSAADAVPFAQGGDGVLGREVMEGLGAVDHVDPVGATANGSSIEYCRGTARCAAGDGCDGRLKIADHDGVNLSFG